MQFKDMQKTKVSMKGQERNDYSIILLYIFLLRDERILQ